MLTALACNKIGKHNTVMSEEQMVGYLIQLHIAEAKVQNLRLKKDSSQVVFDIYNQHLFKKNGLSDSLFINSYNYYLQYPQKLETIYEAVVDSISVRKSIVDVLK